MSDLLLISVQEEDEEETEEEECGQEGYYHLETDFRLITEKFKDNEDEDLQEFCEAYERLFKAFLESYQVEHDLNNQITELGLIIEQHKNIIGSHEKNADEYNTIIENLRVELAEVKQLSDMVNFREQELQETIDNMHSQIMKLNNELELKAKLRGEETEIEPINTTAEGFEREKQRMLDEITSLKQKLANALSYSEDLEHKNSAADLKNDQINASLEKCISESAKKQRNVDKLEVELSELYKDMNDLNVQLENSKEIISMNNKQISALESHVKTSKTETDKAIKLGEMVQAKLDKCCLELQASALELKELKTNHDDLVKSCKLKTDQCNTLQNDVIKLTKQKDNVEKKLMAAERQKYTAQQETNQIRTHAQMLEKEINISKRETDADKKIISNLTKEKLILNKNVMRLQGAIEGHVKLIHIQEQNRKRLDSDYLTTSHRLQESKKYSRKMEKEREKAVSEALDLTQKVEDALDDGNLKQKAIYTLKKIKLELETKLRQQQNLFELVRAERNVLQKHVQENASEIGELKTKYSLIHHECVQLKEDIAVKVAQTVKQENIIKKNYKDKLSLKNDVQNGLNQVKDLKIEIKDLHINERRLTNIITENVKMIKEQEMKSEQLVKDRDILGAQLCRRNDENLLNYEQISILRASLVRGETHYSQRLQDIKLLKTEIKNLRQEQNSLSKSLANMTNFKTEVFNLERDLTAERCKIKALEDEIQRPVNIHRWRKLEASDPMYYDLMEKHNILQKRHFTLTAQSIEREKQLKEAERLYFCLQEVLARQPGPEIKNELIKTRKALTLRDVRMKCLVSELSMSETKALEYKTDIENISTELTETKNKYFKQKKLYEQLSDKLNLKLPAIKTSDTSQTKFIGGGFKMVP